MLTDKIPSFVVRALGPLLFVGGITCFLLMYDNLEKQLQLSKALYLNDEVYSQKNSGMEYVQTVSSSEIVGILLANPTVQIKIVNNHGGRLITVEPLSNGAMYVTVEQGLGDLARSVYAETIFNFQGFNMNYVDVGDYSVNFDYSAAGELECVTYTLISE